MRGQCGNMHLLWGPVTLPERWGDLRGPHGTRLRLQAGLGRSMGGDGTSAWGEGCQSKLLFAGGS